MAKIFLETTEVSDTKTVAEIQELLSSKGASAIMTEYHSGLVNGLSFQLDIEGQKVHFRLPCRWESIQRLLRAKSVRRNDSAQARARRVAWRIMFRWVQAQLAIIETEQAKMEEVFLPYMIIQSGQTLYQAMAEKKFLALPAPAPTQPGGGS